MPDDIKAEAAAEQLGAELVQLSAKEFGIKGHLMKNIRKINLAQISIDDDKLFKSSEEDTPKEGEQSISDLTSNAKEQIKNSEPEPKKEEAAPTEKKEEKKEEPKKEQEKKESDGDDDSDGSKTEKKDDKDGKTDESPKEHALAA